MSRDPAAEGYRLPPEWAPHEATWLAWPHDPHTWVAGIDAAEDAYLSMVTALAPGERIELLVPDTETKKRVQRRLFQQGLDVTTWTATEDTEVDDEGLVRLHVVDYTDSWVRDTGPMVLTREDGARLALDWRFDAWGGKYEAHKRDDRLARLLAQRAGLEVRRVSTVLEGGAVDVDGAGRAVTTEACLLDPARGQDRTRDGMTRLLETHLGVETVLWLGEGIAGDDTDGHVDALARFVAPGHLVVCEETDPTARNHPALADNLDRLATYQDEDPDLEITRLPMPEPVNWEGHRRPASYANFYIGNDVVLLPTYDDPADETARDVLADAFPERRIVPIEAEPLIVGYGACHCLTQQLPAEPR